MKEFADAVRQDILTRDAITHTTNGAVALSTTGSYMLDLFASVGDLRFAEVGQVVDEFINAFNENPLLATKLVFYARNVRGGLGERRTSRIMLRTLAFISPETVIKNLKYIPFFGRWDDVYALIGTKVESAMWDFVGEQLATDNIAMREGKPASLLAKWLKSVNASSEETRMYGKLTARSLCMSEKSYRKNLSELRRYLSVTEKQMSARQWAEIKFDSVPSKAMSTYGNAFRRHQFERFEQFLADVESGEVTINSSTLYPYDLLRNLNVEWLYYNGAISYDESRRAVAEAQWNALPNYVEDENNVIVMADTSGSMMTNNGLPMYTAVGLAMYFAERNKGAYKDLFMTFASRPEFVKLKSGGLVDKLSSFTPLVDNTNLEAGFELILDTAIANNIGADEMPKALIIISDMQFDACVESNDGYSYSRGNDNITFYGKMKKRFESNGYRIPNVIFWNVDGMSKSFQAKANQEGVYLVSGHSTSIFKTVLGTIASTPIGLMEETLNDEMYAGIVL